MVVVAWIRVVSQHGRQSNRGTRIKVVEHIVLVLGRVGVANFYAYLKSAEVGVNAVAPGHGCRTLIIDLRGVILGNVGLGDGVLRWVERIGAVQWRESGAIGIAEIEADVGVRAIEI